MPTNPLLRAAHWYATKAGWPVLPLHYLTPAQLCSCGNHLCKSPAKHPLNDNGLTGASKADSVLRRWWERWPEANIGVRTGAVSGLLVVDVDPRHRGDESLETLLREHGRFPETVEAISGGRHILFRHPGRNIGNSTGDTNGLGSGLDIRCDGGYIVVAPSFSHPNGQKYQWETSSRPDDMKPAPAPDWLIGLLTAPRPDQAKVIPDVIPEGERDTTLTSLAGTMRRRGASEAGILAALRAENERCRPPMDDDDLQRIARSVVRYDPAHPERATAYDDFSLVFPAVREPAEPQTPAVVNDWNEEKADLAVGAMQMRVGEMLEGHSGIGERSDIWEPLEVAIATAYREQSWTMLRAAMTAYEDAARIAIRQAVTA
jgi:hypothetical protein